MYWLTFIWPRQTVQLVAVVTGKPQRVWECVDIHKNVAGVPFKLKYAGILYAEENEHNDHGKHLDNRMIDLETLKMILKFS